MATPSATKMPVVLAATGRDFIQLCIGAAVLFGYFACPYETLVPAGCRELAGMVLLCLCWRGICRQRLVAWRATAGVIDTSESPLHSRIHAAAKAGDVMQAAAIMRQAQDSGASVTVLCYSALISALARTGSLGAMEAWLEELIQSDLGGPSTMLVNVVINAWARQADSPRAEYWLLRMAQLGLVPDVVSYNAAIEACAQAGDVARAEAWLLEMGNRGVQPDAESYGSVLRACASCKELGRAEAWLELMAASGIEPDTTARGAVIPARPSHGSAGVTRV